MSLALRLPRKMHLCRSSSNVPRLPSFLECYKTFTFCSLLRCTIPCACYAKRHLNVPKWREHVAFWAFWLRNVLSATTACTFSTSQLPKVVRTWCVQYILTSKFVSRHNGVHFFDISTYKSGPRMVCFVHFDFEMCFAPQRRALCWHLNFEKWSGPGVFCTFRATTACNSSSLIWPAGSAPAALASLLFDPPEPQISGKTQCFATFLPFRAPGSSFWDFLFFQTFSSLRLSLFGSSFFFSSLLFSTLLFSSLPFPSLPFASLRFASPSPSPSPSLRFASLPFSSLLVSFPLLSSPLLLSSLLFSSLTPTTSAFHLSILSEVWLLNYLRLY